MAFQIMAVIPVVQVVAKALLGLGSDVGIIGEEKASKIVDLASKALGGVGYAIEAFQRIKDSIGESRDWTPADFDALIAEIDANSARIDELTKPSA